MCKSNDLILTPYTLSLCSTTELLVDEETIFGEFSRNFLCHKEAYIFFNIMNILWICFMFHYLQCDTLNSDLITVSVHKSILN